jgi:hypothetical protein
MGTECSTITYLMFLQKHRVLYYNLNCKIEVLSTSNLLTGLPNLAIQVYVRNHLCDHRLGGGSELLCLHLVGVA